MQYIRFRAQVIGLVGVLGSGSVLQVLRFWGSSESVEGLFEP